MGTTSKRRVFYIEDDGQVSLVVGQFFKRQKWEFHSAATGQDGLDRAAEVKPDAILLDVQLPDMEGWDICRELRRKPELASVPIIMVSGRLADPESKAKGLEAGADDFLGKPFDLTELALRIEAILRARGK